MSLELLERRACAIHVAGTDPGSALLADLTEELGDFQGPATESKYRATGAEQGLVRDGRARPDLLDTNFDDQLKPECLPAAAPLERDRFGDYTIIHASVLARFDALGPTPPVPPPPSSPSTLSTCPFVKLRITSPQWRGPVWIDCDRAMTIESPRACIEVVGPEGWVNADSAPANTIPVEDVWHVWIFLKICRAFCCPTGLPILTEFFQLNAETPTRTIVRPRGTRRVWFGSLAQPQVWELLSGTSVVGTIILPANSFQSIDLAPGITAIRNQPLVGVVNQTIAWEVQP